MSGSGEGIISMKTVLSYFKSYFTPGIQAPFFNHSAGRIAEALYHTLSDPSPVDYYDQEEKPRGLKADLYVGHFYSFARFCRDNHFQKKVVFYSISDPDRRHRMLRDRAEMFRVPVAPWDAPPPDFDHEETMGRADLILLVGNEYTRQTFPRRWWEKIRLLSYSVDRSLYYIHGDRHRDKDMVYAATSCSLRKGFMDILRVWSGITPEEGLLHVVGKIEPPWDALLKRYDSGSIRYHGWIDSHDPRYGRILRGCRHAHLPTYEEGQMGTALESLFSGCIPITTLASGLDDRVLEHCIVVEPTDIEGQRRAVLQALNGSHQDYLRVRKSLLPTAETYQSWEGFRQGVQSGLQEIGHG